MMKSSSLLRKFSLADGIKRFRTSDPTRKNCEIVYSNKEFEELICSIFLLDKYYPSEKNLKFETSNIPLFKSITKDMENLFQFCTGRKLSIKLISKSNGRMEKQQRIFQGKANGDRGSVLLFSGGLDSACGALHLRKSGETPYLSHTATGNIVLGQARRVAKHPILRHLPMIESNMRFSRFTEADSSQVSTRGLLFLSNALILASSFRKKHVYFAENGPLMMNPPVSSLSNSTKNAHPNLIKTLESIFNQLSESKIEIISLFKNKTKAETIAPFISDDIVDRTWSCFKIQGQSKMCGLCYACLVRRLSALAAGYEEPPNTYRLEAFLVKRKELSQIARQDMDILHDVFVYLKKVLDNEVIIDEANYSIPLGFFNDINELLRRFSLDFYLGFQKYLQISKPQNLGDLGVFVKQLLNDIDSSDLKSRESFLKTLRSSKATTEYF